MDPKKLEQKIRQDTINELKQNYVLIPKSKKLEINDIFEKYKEELVTRGQVKHNGVLRVGKDYGVYDTIKSAIRRVVCLHIGVASIHEVPKEKYNEFRIELEKFIVDYLNIERK